MNVKQGDRVLVGGVEAVVESSWGAGAHRAFKLSDGRTVLDLDKLVDAGKASLVVKNNVTPKALPTLEVKKWFGVREPMPKDHHDVEE